MFQGGGIPEEILEEKEKKMFKIKINLKRRMEMLLKGGEASPPPCKTCHSYHWLERHMDKTGWECRYRVGMVIPVLR